MMRTFSLGNVHSEFLLERQETFFFYFYFLNIFFNFVNFCLEWQKREQHVVLPFRQRDRRFSFHRCLCALGTYARREQRWSSLLRVMCQRVAHCSWKKRRFARYHLYRYMGLYSCIHSSFVETKEATVTRSTRQRRWDVSCDSTSLPNKRKKTSFQFHQEVQEFIHFFQTTFYQELPYLSSSLKDFASLFYPWKDRSCKPFISLVSCHYLFFFFLRLLSLALVTLFFFSFYFSLANKLRVWRAHTDTCLYSRSFGEHLGQFRSLPRDNIVCLLLKI